MRGRLPTPRGDARFTQPTGQDPPARPRSAARLHTNSRTTGHATPRTQKHGMGGWVPTERGATPRSRPKTHSGPRRSVIRARPGSGSSPTPVTAWLPSASMAAPKGGGGSAALCLPSASPLSDARCRSHETRLCAPSGWHFFTPAPTTETPSIAEFRARSNTHSPQCTVCTQSHSCRTCRILAQ
jgi:hypothetical protein